MGGREAELSGAPDVDELEQRLVAVTSELVRQHRRTEVDQMLLDLHAACTRQRSAHGTARQVAAVASALVDASAVVVSVSDPVSQEPITAVAFGSLQRDADQVTELAMALPRSPEMSWLYSDSRARILHRGNRGGVLGALLGSLPDERAALLPLLGQGEYIGVVVAALPDQRYPGGATALDDFRLDVLEELQPHAGDLVHLSLVLDELRRRALSDATSGLPNLVVFEQRLSRALAREEPDEVAVVVIQVDGMASVTDSFGARGAAALLRGVATRLLEVAPEHDLGHLGAGQFAVLAHGVFGVGIDLAATIRRVFTAPFNIMGTPVKGSCRLGMAVADGKLTPGELVHQAEQLMREDRPVFLDAAG